MRRHIEMDTTKKAKEPKKNTTQKDNMDHNYLNTFAFSGNHFVRSDVRNAGFLVLCFGQCSFCGT